MSRTSLPTAPGQRSSAAKTAHHRTGDRAGTGCNRRNRRLVVVCRTGQLLSVPKPDDVTCDANASTECSLAGADWATYESTLKALGIPYKTHKEYSDDVAEGKIISSSVNKTKAVVNSRISKRANQELTVVVSKGVRMTTIPKDILDANSANGKDPLNALKKAGFDNVKHDESKDEYSMDTPQGVALTISPDPGTTAKHNDEVTVTLSKGPMPVTMPNIVGKTQDEMQAALGELKLTANVTEQYDDKVEGPAKSFPRLREAGAQLKWGDSVDVVISRVRDGDDTVRPCRQTGKRRNQDT